MEQSTNINVKGWGSDADFNKRPYHPVHKIQTDTGAHWIKPVRQQSDVEVLHSNERPDLTSVFGTTLPPQGLSGVIRRLAFRYSENSFRHWLPLIFADRVNMIEGMVDDVRNKKMPRLMGDGLMVDYKYNPKAFYFRILKGAVVATAPVVLFYFLLREKK